MFVQLLTTQGLGQLCPATSKIASLLLALCMGLALQNAKAQVIVDIVEVDVLSSFSTTEASNLASQDLYSAEAISISYLDVFPNPFDAHLTIKASSEDGLSYLELIDEEGEVVWERNVYGNQGKFIIQSLEPGNYYLNLSLATGSFTKSLEYRP